MEHYIYETHQFADSRLPFIFHPCHTIRTRELPPNWHENIELLLCIGGKGHVRCGAMELLFCPGDLFVVNADTPHVVVSNSKVSYRCLIISKTFFTENGLPERSFQPLLHDTILSELMESVCLAYQRYQRADVYAVADIRLAVMQILQRLYQAYTVPYSPPSASGDHVKTALSYIRSNLARSVSLQEVSDHIGVSKYHLARQFKQYTGSTLTQTANLIRCLEAQRLIEGGMSIASAAFACGFENLSYFSRTYKRLLHSLPSHHKSRKNG